MPPRRRGGQQGGVARRGRAAAQASSEPAAPAAGAVLPKRAAAPLLQPALAEVLSAVESLYLDELKPFGRILRKRVAELARCQTGLEGDAEDGPEAGACAEVDVDMGHLRRLCEASTSLRVEAEEGGDWSALLVEDGRGADPFIDVYSPADEFPAELWADAKVYFDQQEGEEMVLPGGRYSCAQTLAGRGLPFLSGRSLGQICHVVQLAISQQKLLGYRNGTVVPYRHSQSMVKERCATQQQACCASAHSPSALPLASWDTARSGLRTILRAVAGSGPGPGVVPLSNIKRLFLSQLHLELSETTLGHSKLSELLQDERFSDVCSVQLEGNGYNVIQRMDVDVGAGPQCFTPPGGAVEASADPLRVQLQVDDFAGLRATGDIYAEVDGLPLVGSPDAMTPVSLALAAPELCFGFNTGDSGLMLQHVQSPFANHWPLFDPLLTHDVPPGFETPCFTFPGQPGSEATTEAVEGSSDDDVTAYSRANSRASPTSFSPWPMTPDMYGNLAMSPPGICNSPGFHFGSAPSPARSEHAAHGPALSPPGFGGSPATVREKFASPSPLRLADLL